MRLSIFIDESGSWKPYGHALREPKIPYQDQFFLGSVVFHYQEDDISEQVRHFYQLLGDYEMKRSDVHFGPLIRRENDFYKSFSIEETRKFIFKFAETLRHTNIKCATFVFDKKELFDKNQFVDAFIVQFDKIVDSNPLFFGAADTAIEYYDKGTAIVSNFITKGINKHFLVNDNRWNIKPSDYYLFQVCDFLCTMKLIELKQAAGVLSSTERNLFKDWRLFKKKVISTINKKSILL